MAKVAATFKLAIMTPDALLYQNEVESVFFFGDQGEFELLAYHYPVLAILQQGNIIVNWQEAVPIKFKFPLISEKKHALHFILVKQGIGSHNR